MPNRLKSAVSHALRGGWMPAAILLGSLLPSSPAFAANSDIHIGRPPSCVAGGCYVYGGETNNLESNALDVYSNGKNLTGSVLLFFAVPDVSADTLGQFPILSASYNGLSVGVTAGPSSFAGTGFAYSNQALGLISGTMSFGNIYSFLGLPGDASNSFVNFQSWDQQERLTPSSYLVYAYELSSGIEAKQAIDVTYALPKGTFVAGYGMEQNGNYADNAFTEAGLTTADTCTGSSGACSYLSTGKSSVPEPTSLSVLGVGLLALGLTRKLRARRGKTIPADALMDRA